jgi:hypothetical protein
MHFTKLVVSSSVSEKPPAQQRHSGLVNLLGEHLG